MIDINRAHSVYSDFGSFNFDLNDEPFMEYSPAYVTTNEDIKFVIRHINPQNKTVLVNTGSGDGPMLYRAHGAKVVDSFDISYCAKAMMDIKVSAIRNMDRRQYTNLLNQLYAAKTFDKYQYVINGCPIETRRFIRGMDGSRIFSNGTGVNYDLMPDTQEYHQMRKNIRSPMSFIWSDLDSLSGKLTKQYDIMYLSNIFQYACNKHEILRALNSLKSHLNVGGHIMVHATWFFRDFELKNYAWIADQVAPWAKFYMAKNKSHQYMMLQRTR